MLFVVLPFRVSGRVQLGLADTLVVRGVGLVASPRSPAEWETTTRGVSFRGVLKHGSISGL